MATTHYEPTCPRISLPLASGGAQSAGLSPVLRQICFKSDRLRTEASEGQARQAHHKSKKQKKNTHKKMTGPKRKRFKKRKENNSQLANPVQRCPRPLYGIRVTPGHSYSSTALWRIWRGRGSVECFPFRALAGLPASLCIPWWPPGSTRTMQSNGLSYEFLGRELWHSVQPMVAVSAKPSKRQIADTEHGDIQ